MPSVISGDANVSATEFGYLDGVTSSLQTQIDSKLPLAGGKILQIVQGTTSTTTTTNSTTPVNTSLSVSITPSSASNKVLVVAAGGSLSHTDNAGSTRISLARNSTQISDSECAIYFGSDGSGLNAPPSLIYLDSPNTTSATTYRTLIVTSNAANQAAIGGKQVIIAMEVSA